MSVRRGTKWTLEDMETLLLLLRSGTSRAEIAKSLQRTECGITCKLINHATTMLSSSMVGSDDIQTTLKLTNNEMRQANMERLKRAERELRRGVRESDVYKKYRVTDSDAPKLRQLYTIRTKKLIATALGPKSRLEKVAAVAAVINVL